MFFLILCIWYIMFLANSILFYFSLQEVLEVVQVEKIIIYTELSEVNELTEGSEDEKNDG